MADISRAMNTPPPAGQQPQAQPVPRVSQDDLARTLAQEAANERIGNEKRDAKNERDRLRRKAKRAADAKAAALEAAMPKKKKAKKKKPTDIYDAMKAQAARNPAKKRTVGKSPLLAAPYGKKRRRGRPPGAKNKPKAEGLVAVAAQVSAPRSSLTVLAQINAAVALLNAMPEHARKVVLDAVK